MMLSEDYTLDEFIRSSLWLKSLGTVGIFRSRLCNKQYTPGIKKVN